MRGTLSSPTIGRAPKIACRVNKRAARVFPTSGRGNRSRPVARRSIAYGGLRTPGATRVPEPLVFHVVHSSTRLKKFRKKYNRFTMAKARQLQCKALRELE